MRAARRHAFACAIAAGLAGSLLGTSAQAATINFGGRNWNTYDAFATGQYSPGQWNDYWVSNNNSGSMGGRFGVDTILTTGITANVGDKISYDYVLTTDSVDLGNDGASQWIGDNYASLRPDAGFYPGSKVTGHTGYYWFRDLWFSDPFDGGWTNVGTTSNATGVHFEYAITSSTTYTVSVWNAPGNPSGPAAASYSSSLNGGVAAIQAFRVSLWDSEQTATISDFKRRPTVPAQSGNEFVWTNPGASDYNTGTNWLGASAPTLADHALIANGGTATVNGSGLSAAHVVTLAIGGTTGNGTVEVQSGGELFSANSIRLGTSTGTGTVNQTGGLVAIDLGGDRNLRIGHDPGGTGFYNLSGGELWVADSFTVGKDGAGTFTMTGGWVSHAGFITVGRTAGSNGTFDMSAGVIDQTFGDFEIGNFSTGTANLSGGTFNGAPGRAFAVGNRLGGTGIATISGTALVKTEDLYIAGNDNTVTSLGGTGTLNINGGEVQINDDFVVGNYGAGTLTMTGGLVSETGWIVVANNPGSTGTFNMSGGTINQSFGDLEIGDAGSGTYNQIGGTVNVADGIYIAKQAGSTGDANISGGTLNSDFIVNNSTSSLDVSGTATVNTGPIDGPGAMTVAGSAQVNATHVRQSSLGMTGGVVNVAASGGAASGTSVVNSVSVNGAKLNLTDNKLITQTATGGWDGSNYSGVLGLVKSGRNGGAWNGNGIVTSMTAAVGAAALTTLAVASADELGRVGSTFGGVTLASGDTMVMYTYGGDANLSGFIDADDYFQIDSNYGKTGNSDKSYFKGDFNYDGSINGDDYFIIDSNFAQGPPFSSSALQSGVSAVPEPAGAALLLLATSSLMRRQRRSG